MSILRRRREGRGQSLVEFALILPIFVLLLVGVLDFGRAIYAYNTINNAAREGGRLATVDQTVADIQALAASRAATLNIAPGDVYVDFRRHDQSTTESSCDGRIGQSTIVGCVAVVRVPYQYTAATPILSQILGTILMNGETKFRIETACPNTADGIVSCPIGD